MAVMNTFSMTEGFVFMSFIFVGTLLSYISKTSYQLVCCLPERKGIIEEEEEEEGVESSPEK